MPENTLPQPENIGDIYRVWGYSGVEGWRYGAAYMDTDPADSTRWCWFLFMDDGDVFLWHKDPTDMLDELFGADRIELERRNPLGPLDD